MDVQEIGVKLFTVMLFILPNYTASRILMTKQQCGRSFDLTLEKELYLDYEGADLGEFWSSCEIKITNEDAGEEICIKTNSTFYLDSDCAVVLRYYIGGYRTFENMKNCWDFSVRPVCDRSRVSSVVYSYTRNYDGPDITIRLYKQKYIPTTTSRYTPSSWSSWSSDFDNDDDDDDSSDYAGTVFGVIVGLLVVFAVVFSCLCAKARKYAAQTQIGSAAAAQNQSRVQQGNQYTNQTQNLPYDARDQQQYQLNQSSFQPRQYYSPVPPRYAGYHVHVPVYQEVPGQDTVTGPQSYPSSQISAQPDSDPPPPYPGY